MGYATAEVTERATTASPFVLPAPDIRYITERIASSLGSKRSQGGNKGSWTRSILNSLDVSPSLTVEVGMPCSCAWCKERLVDHHEQYGFDISKQPTRAWHSELPTY